MLLAIVWLAALGLAACAAAPEQPRTLLPNTSTAPTSSLASSSAAAPRPPEPKGFSSAVEHPVDCIVVGDDGSVSLLGEGWLDSAPVLSLTRIDAEGRRQWSRSYELDRWHAGVPSVLFTTRCGAAVDGQLTFAGAYLGTLTLKKDDRRSDARLKGDPQSLFVASVDGQGKLQWFQTFTGAAVLAPPAPLVAVAADGRVALGGAFNGTHVFAGKTLASGGHTRPFLLELSSDGQVQRARAFVTQGRPAELAAIAFDAQGRLAVAARFEQQIDFGDGPRSVRSGAALAIFETDGRVHRIVELPHPYITALAMDADGGLRLFGDNKGKGWFARRWDAHGKLLHSLETASGTAYDRTTAAQWDRAGNMIRSIKRDGRLEKLDATTARAHWSLQQTTGRWALLPSGLLLVAQPPQQDGEWLTTVLATLDASGKWPSCAASPACAASGRCSGALGQCNAESDESCRASAACRSIGHCSLEQGRCVAKHDTDCQGSWGCQQQDRCRARSGQCVTTDKSCGASSACAYGGLCKASAAGDTCIEGGTPAQCERSSACRESGACALVSNACQPTMQAHCMSSTACREHGACKLGKSSSGAGCEPKSKADCRASTRCKQDGQCQFNTQCRGRCTTPGGCASCPRCEVGTNRDCVGSQGCREHGDCTAVPFHHSMFGYVTKHCRLISSGDCKRTIGCKRDGRCRFDNGRCVT